MTGPRLDARLRQLGEEVGRREADRLAARDEARRVAEDLRARLERALDAFAGAAAAAGSPHLRGLLEVGPVEPDDKSVRAFQIRIERGRHEAVVVSKDRGEIMLVGPYRRGEEQGPCNPVTLAGESLADDQGLDDALESFLEALVRQSFSR